MSTPCAVVALGGNALLRRGEPLEAPRQEQAARTAAEHLARAASGRQLVITHGNGPQVGLLALMSRMSAEGETYPLDVLDAESEGQIGYVLALELDNALPDRQAVAVVTRVVVDEHDPAFTAPAKPIGPVLPATRARVLADRHGWTLAADGDGSRRVVASPEPRRIVELPAIAALVGSGFLVLCVGGGGIPVVAGEGGRLRGVEAVVDKDLASALLAAELGADTLVLATDVDAVYDGWGTADACPIRRTSPVELRAREFAPGSMRPKVEAVCRFVERTGGRGAIGALDELDALVAGAGGTQVLPATSSMSPPERTRS
jgi:carbamate kinase